MPVLLSRLAGTRQRNNQRTQEAMTRIDVPTLRCDRCKRETQDIDEMGKYQTLTGIYDGYQGASEKWDLCPDCWKQFINFTKGYAT
jgi:hypothetical protein